MDLKEKSNWIRRQILETAVLAGKAHLGGAFSCVEIITALYYGKIMNFSPENPDMEGRDRFILSKGHACLTLYSVLSDLGFFSPEKLKNYGRNGSILGGHPDHRIPGVEVSSGSLGHGLGIGSGLALSAKLDKKPFSVLVLLGDGECCEGSVWEAANFASARNLDNLVAIIDNNKVGATCPTQEYSGISPLKEKWEGFGWDTREISGHNFNEIFSVLSDIHSRNSGRPLAIVANTIKGKGVSFMENDFHWHHGVPKGELLEKARIELEYGK